MQTEITFIRNLLVKVMQVIDETPDAQYDDVADYMDEIELIVEEHFSATSDIAIHFSKVMDTAYASKGDMADARDDIQEMVDNL